jgi:hypothetical protein
MLRTEIKNRFKWLFIVVVALVILGFLEFSATMKKLSIFLPTPTPSIVYKTRPVGLYLGKDFVQIEQDKILINPCDKKCNSSRKSMVINKETYPELFEIYDEFTRIQTEQINDISGKNFIFFTKNVPDHGGYAALYGVIVDPETGSVVYTTPKELKSPLSSYQILKDGVILFNLHPYLFNNSCTSCRLGMFETVAYDNKQKKYVSVNRRSISLFKTLLEQYNKAAADCYYKGQKRTVQEVLSIGGKDARCEDELFPSNPKQNNSFITVGEFLDIKSKIQKIIDGQELSIVNYEN